MSGDIQVHRQVPINNTKILEETKLALQKLFKKFYFITSKSNNDKGQTDLTEMNIAARPDSTPVAAQPYPLAFMHHDFFNKK